LKSSLKYYTWLSKNAEKVAIVIILIAAALLRFWRLWDVPFMHDEFSALFRVGYESFTQLIREGVTPDAHPAGTQILLHYLVAIAGTHAFWLKLPFALMGIGSVWLVYQIGKQLFHETAGLISASLIATMQYFVFFSQIARPYSSGLFFVLLAVFFGIKVIKSQSKTIGIETVGFALSLVLASMMHYFAMMMAGFIFISFFFLANRDNKKKLIYTGLLSILLYLPNLGIFFRQLSAGGIGDWLGKPSPDFVTQFLLYTFHFSAVFIITILNVFVLALNYMDFGRKPKLIYSLNLILWFALSLGIGWTYSILRTPVIQFSTLYFSFPFLILGISGFTRQLKPQYNVLIVIILVSMGAFTLINSRQHYKTMYEQGYDQIALRFDKNQDIYKEDITQVAVGGSVRMLDFYLQKQQNTGVILFNKNNSSTELSLLIDSCQTRYFAIGWTDYTSFNWVETVRNKYTKVVEQQNWFNSGYYLFEREEVEGETPFLDARYLVKDKKQTGIVRFTEKDEYGLLWESAIDSTIISDDGIIVSGYRIKALTEIRDLSVVLEIKVSGVSEPVMWRSGTLDGRIIKEGETFTMIVVHHLDAGPAIPPNSKLRTYVWNKAKASFDVTERWVYIKKQDPWLFGLYGSLK